MKVLVTGGAGFIGRHVVDELLAAGHQPVVVDNFSTGQRSNLPPEVPVYEVDVRDKPGLAAVFERERPERVAHQAAQMSVGRSVQEPSYDADVNIVGLLNTLELAVQTGVQRFVFASSGGVLYGDVQTPAPESTPANPISPYGISKWVGERYLQFFSAEHGLPTVALRYANVYGPRQNPHGEAGVVAIFCQRMLSGQPVTINGDGQYIRDYVFVEDVARANLLALTSPLPETHLAVNIGTGVGRDVNELAEVLRSQAQHALREFQSPITVPKAQHGPVRAGDLRSNLVDAGLIGQLWNWSPQTDWRTGIENTVAWFAKQHS